jgi:hypothetical protein
MYTAVVQDDNTETLAGPLLTERRCNRGVDLIYSIEASSTSDLIGEVSQGG